MQDLLWLCVTLVERLDSNGVKDAGISRCEFHLYFPENVEEGRYTS